MSTCAAEVSSLHSTAARSGSRENVDDRLCPETQHFSSLPRSYDSDKMICQVNAMTLGLDVLRCDVIF